MKESRVQTPGDERDRLATVLRPVRAGNGFEEALEQILQVVRLGLVAEGERLPSERELAGRLGISRVTLREVLRVLTGEGLVISRRGRHGGTFVRRPELSGAAPPSVDAAEVEDMLIFREALETGAAAACAARPLSHEETARLRGALDTTRESPAGDYRRHDTLFHLTLVELAGSGSLTAQYASVRARVNGLLDRIPLLVRNLEHAQQQHTALVDAVTAGDTVKALEVTREHCEGTAALLRGFLGGPGRRDGTQP